MCPKKVQNFIKRLMAFIFAAYWMLPMKGYSYTVGDIDIKPRAELRQAFDDNITSVYENEKQDFITNLSLGLDMKYEGRLQNFGLVGTINQQLFVRESDFNNIAQDLKVNYQNEFSKYDRLSITNRFLRAEEPRSFEDAFGRISGRYNYYRNQFEMTYDKDMSRQFALQLRYGNEIYEVSREDLSGSFLQRMNIEIDYTQSADIRFLLGYDFSTRKFNPGDAAFEHHVTLGYRQVLNKQVTLDTQIGVSFIDSFGTKDLTKPNIFVSLKNEVDEITNYTFSFRKKGDSTTSTQDIFDSWRVAIGFGRKLARKDTMSLSAFYGEGKYDTTAVKDIFTGVNARLNHDISEDIQMFVAYAFLGTNSNNETRSYDKNTTSFGFTFRF